MTMMGSNMI